MRPDDFIALCLVCGQAHAPTCDELDQLVPEVVVDRGAPPPGFVSWDAAEAWVRDALALHAHESLGWNAGEASRIHQTLEAMWALPCWH